MFGMGGTEILVILIVALLFLGPDKLPDAAKKISKGIRDIKRQSRVLQRTIEDDEHIGGAIRDLRSALRGEDEPYRPPPIKPRKEIEASTTPDPLAADAEHAVSSFEGGHASSAGPPDVASTHTAAHEDAPAALPPGATEAKLTLPPTAGEPDGATPGRDDAELAVLVKPAPNTVARSTSTGSPEPPEPKHG